MKEFLKQRLNIFLKLRHRLASIKWILLLVTTAMFFLSAASNTCTFSFGPGGPVVGPPSGNPPPSQTSTVGQPPPQMPSPVSSGTPAGSGTPAAAPTTPSGSPPSGSPPTGNIEKVMMVVDPKNPSGFAFKDLTSGTDVTTIKKGTTVMWVNATAIPHTVTSDDGKFKSSDPAQPLAKGGMYSFTFTTAGKFTYHCSIHPPQVGTIIVTA